MGENENHPFEKKIEEIKFERIKIIKVNQRGNNEAKMLFYFMFLSSEFFFL